MRISVINSDGSAVEDAVVVLNTPKVDGATLTFDVAVLEGEKGTADGPASLFIDWFAARVGFGRVGVAGGSGGILRSGTAPGMSIRRRSSSTTPSILRGYHPYPPAHILEAWAAVRKFVV